MKTRVFACALLTTVCLAAPLAVPAAVPVSGIAYDEVTKIIIGG